MSDNLESRLCDLVEQRATEHHESLARLWKRVFTAIRDRKLDFDETEPKYAGRNPPPLPYDPPPHHVRLNYIRETLCVSALSAIENGDDLPPWGQAWVKRMLVSAAAFDKMLFPADPKQPVGRTNLAEPLADFLKKAFPDGLPPSIARENIARMAKGTVGIVSLRTVSRAKKLLSKGRTK
jgi:hypothetical protein